MNFLSGPKPGPTNIGQLIDMATDPHETEDKYELFYEISDLINSREETGKEAMRAIRKKLNIHTGNSWISVAKLLKLLEICAQNCNAKFQVQLANKEFLNELKAMIGPKQQPPIVIQETVLSMIEKWTQMFSGRSDMKAIEVFYTEMKMKGIEFPAENKAGGNNSDVLNRIPTTSIPGPVSKSSQPPQQQRTVIPNAAQAVRLNEDQINKLKNELNLVDVNIIIMNEIICEYQSSGSSNNNNNNMARDAAFLKELYLTTSEMQKRITQLIGNISNEDIISELLRINDDLNNVFLRYERFKRSMPMGSNTNDLEPVKKGHVIEDKPLIDFGSEPMSSSNVNIELGEERKDSIDLKSAENQFLQDENEIEEMENWLKIQELENSKGKS